MPLVMITGSKSDENGNLLLVMDVLAIRTISY
jgi:hypothetical protein